MSSWMVILPTVFVLFSQMQVTYLTITTESRCKHYGWNNESTCIPYTAVTTEVCCLGFICGKCLDLDECKYGHAICGHRGHCHNTLGGFTCSCLEGWTGHHCRDRMLNETSSCLHGWSGERCSIPLCVHGSLIKNNECRCDPGWTGDKCNVTVSVVDTNSDASTSTKRMDGPNTADTNSDASTTTYRMSRPTTGTTLSSSHKDASKSTKTGVIIGASVGGACIVAASIAVAIVAVKYNIIRK